MQLEYLKLADGTHLPHRVEVRFSVEDIQGLQVSTFSNRRPAQWQ